MHAELTAAVAQHTQPLHRRQHYSNLGIPSIYQENWSVHLRKTNCQLNMRRKRSFLFIAILQDFQNMTAASKTGTCRTNDGNDYGCGILFSCLERRIILSMVRGTVRTTSTLSTLVNYFVFYCTIRSSKVNVFKNTHTPPRKHNHKASVSSVIK